MQTSRVLIIDDEPILLDTLASTVRLRLPDVHIERADSGSRLLAHPVDRVCRRPV